MCWIGQSLDFSKVKRAVLIMKDREDEDEDEGRRSKDALVMYIDEGHREDDLP
jgi:hypothetical protein